jgi:replicative DNA helicase
MIQIQALNRILKSGDMSFVINNALDASYFEPYQDEFNFICEHYAKYKTVPNKETFINKFPDFQFFDVTETDSYLLDALSEDKLYRDAVPVIQKTAEILKTNSVDAVQYLMSNAEILNKKIGITSVDIAKSALKRYETWEKKKSGNIEDYVITTGFTELDDAIHGWSRGEELVILFARTNQGKSWILAKTLTHAWQIGYNVGFISPEMSDDKIGYRCDTIANHFDNQALNFGSPIDGYEEYIKSLTTAKNKFMVSTPRDFDNTITVNKIRTFIETYQLDILGIDGLSYLIDERAGKFDKREAELTHISEDLFNLSMEYRIPIIAVVQANRDGVKINGGNLELENIRDADGISFNASKIISIRQRVDEETIEFNVKKNRDGKVGTKLLYKWSPNFGDFKYIPVITDEPESREEVDKTKSKYEVSKKKGASVF